MADPDFSTPVTNPFGLTDVGYHATPTFADIDGDGDLDAFMVSDNDEILFFRNTGTTQNPVFAAPEANPFDFGLYQHGYGIEPTFADIDGDGDLDAFIGEYYGYTLFFRNTGTSKNPVFYAYGFDSFGLTNAGYHASPTFADINGDGDLDAFIGNSNGNVIFFRNTGTAQNPVFAKTTFNPFGLSDVGINASPTFADIDGDGDLDAFIGGGDGNIAFYLNTGTAKHPMFVAPEVNPFGLTHVDNGASPTFADIDDDGDLDAFIGDQQGNIQFFLNTDNDAPTATNISQTITYTEDKTATIADIVVADPNITDTITATVTLAGGNSAIATLSASSGHGETYMAATGVWTVSGTLANVNAALAALSFVPVANGFANTSASVKVSDGIAPALTGTLTFNGKAVNDAPIGLATAVVAAGSEDTAYIVSVANLLQGFSDVDGDSLSVSSLTADHGSVVKNKNGSFTITPEANYSGVVNLSYNVIDGKGGSVAATQKFSLATVNDAPGLTTPVAINYVDTIKDDHFPSKVNLLIASDIDEDSLTYSLNGGVDNAEGTVSLSSAYGVLTVSKATGAYVFVPDDAAIEALKAKATAVFTVTVTDGGLTDSETLTVTINQQGKTESLGNDKLTGTAANESFNGLAGKDSITGGAGNDSLNGGTGNDKLTGGSGLDVFIFDTAPLANVDSITDFVVADDTIQLENAVFNQLTAAGALNPVNFVIGASALDSNDFVVYNPANGALLYDADGNGAGAAVSIATLGVNLALTAADFVVS